MLLLRSTSRQKTMAVIVLCFVSLFGVSSCFSSVRPQSPFRYDRTVCPLRTQSKEGQSQRRMWWRRSVSSGHLCARKNDDDFEDWNELSKQLDFGFLQQRVRAMRLEVDERMALRPPYNPDLSPQDFVTTVLQSLRTNDDPWPDAGVETLLRSSTNRWKQLIYQSIGAPKDASLEAVMPALSAALVQPTNQFHILLLPSSTKGTDNYVLDFPTEPVDFLEDSSCWVECRLRHSRTDQLLVITGWSLRKQKQRNGKNGHGVTWMLDGLEWQDFRDEFRPGIGREEWMRICG